MAGLDWIMLFLYLNTCDGAPPPPTIQAQFVPPLASYQGKIRLSSPKDNILSGNKPLELLLGPAYSRKKTRNEKLLGSKSAEKFYQKRSNNNMSLASLSNLFTSEAVHRSSPKFVKHKKRTVADLLLFNGYQYEEHEVTTEDGYILTIFQLLPCVTTESPFTNDTGPRPARITIYLHGFMESAIQWLIGEPGGLYPYDGVENGREVWLLNFRGNEYGMQHKTLSNKSPAFWKFSFHEQAVYDMPALMDYILKNTVMKAPAGQFTQVNFLAHGLGTTVFYIFLDYHGKKYSKHTNIMIALSPLAYNSRSPGIIKALIPFVEHFVRDFRDIGTIYVSKTFPIDGPVFSNTIRDFLHFSVPELCVIQFRGRSLCDPVIFFLYGDGAGDLNPAVIRRFFENFPTTTSKRNLVHFLQLSQFDAFRQFDHGLELNYLYYNQTAPPPYNLYNVQVRTLSFYGQTDTFIDPRDVEQTLNKFGPTDSLRASVQITDYTTIQFLLDENLPLVIDSLANLFIENKFT